MQLAGAGQRGQRGYSDMQEARGGTGTHVKSWLKFAKSMLEWVRCIGRGRRTDEEEEEEEEEETGTGLERLPATLSDPSHIHPQSRPGGL